MKKIELNVLFDEIIEGTCGAVSFFTSMFFGDKRKK